ncbi:hypothetical protein [Streptomyces sp. NPDC002104]
MTNENPRTSPISPPATEPATAIRGHRWLAPDQDPPFTQYATELVLAGEPDGESADGADTGTGIVGIGRCDCVTHTRIRDDVDRANHRPRPGSMT